VARELIYRPLAEEDLEAIYRFIAQDSPARAFRIFYGGQDYETIMSGEGEEDVGR
jgi:hypothetical protein